MLWTPFEKLNIFMLSTARMLKQDLAVFMVLYGWLGASMLIALYFIYPTASGRLPIVPAFSEWYEAAYELLALTLTQTTSKVHLAPELFDGLTNAQKLDLGLFAILYLGYVLLSVILLLNLLIAMMSYTFAAVRIESTLECRVAFAQVVMRHELMAASLGMGISVGERARNGRSYFRFRTVERDCEGRHVEDANASDPFADHEMATADDDGAKHASATARPADLGHGHGHGQQGAPTEATLFAKMRDEMLTLLRQELGTFHKRHELGAVRAHFAPQSEPHSEMCADLHSETCVASASDKHTAALATTHGKLSVLDRAPMLPSSPTPVSRRVLPNLGAVGAAAQPPEPQRGASCLQNDAPSLDPDPVHHPVQGGE